MKKMAGTAQSTTTLLTELEHRFCRLTDPSHDPLFLTATTLDPIGIGYDSIHHRVSNKRVAETLL